MQTIIKTVFSFFIFFQFIAPSYAREIIVISYKKGDPDIAKMKKSIQNQFHILLKLFTFKEMDSSPCESISKESVLHLCIEGENVRTLHANAEVLKNSFSIFNQETTGK